MSRHWTRRRRGTKWRCFWVTKLRDDLGGSYFVLQSRQAILLCDQRWKLRVGCSITPVGPRSQSRSIWVTRPGVELSASMCCSSFPIRMITTDMSRIIRSNGEQAGSGGACIHSGYTHIVVPWQTDVANVTIHELTHVFLRPEREMPLRQFVPHERLAPVGGRRDGLSAKSRDRPRSATRQRQMSEANHESVRESSRWRHRFARERRCGCSRNECTPHRCRLVPPSSE